MHCSMEGFAHRATRGPSDLVLEALKLIHIKQASYLPVAIMQLLSRHQSLT